jgi:protein phosphatase
VPAAREYYAPIKPLFPAEDATTTAQVREATLLDLEDVSGKRVIETRAFRAVTIREENSVAALEVMSRFAIDPRWLVYLPPTMAPPETAKSGDLLERPQEAMEFYRQEGIRSLVCEEKHMGSRAVIVLCRDAQTAMRRFGIGDDGRGVIYTRTGRRFFNDRDLENALLDRLDLALQRAALWEELQSDWIVLDTELLPWSAKAQELLREQYAPTGARRRRGRLAPRVRGFLRPLRAASKFRSGKRRTNPDAAMRHASSMHTAVTAGRSIVSRISRLLRSMCSPAKALWA